MLTIRTSFLDSMNLLIAEIILRNEGQEMDIIFGGTCVLLVIYFLRALPIAVRHPTLGNYGYYTSGTIGNLRS